MCQAIYHSYKGCSHREEVRVDKCDKRVECRANNFVWKCVEPAHESTTCCSVCRFLEQSGVMAVLDELRFSRDGYNIVLLKQLRSATIADQEPLRRFQAAPPNRKRAEAINVLQAAEKVTIMNSSERMHQKGCMATDADDDHGIVGGVPASQSKYSLKPVGTGKGLTPRFVDGPPAVIGVQESEEPVRTRAATMMAPPRAPRTETAPRELAPVPAAMTKRTRARASTHEPVQSSMGTRARSKSKSWKQKFTKVVANVVGTQNCSRRSSAAHEDERALLYEARRGQD